jgi:arylsulfatase A-like enzyme
VSLPGYAEIFAGRPGACSDNHCPQTHDPTLIDELAAAPPRPPGVAVVSSWESIARVATRSPAEHTVSSGWIETPHLGRYRPDSETARLALEHLERDEPRFLFVGLGDTDEHAHHGDYAGYLGALRRADAFLGDLRGSLTRMGERGRRTTVIVTTDHGRADSFLDHGAGAPESSRTWLAAFGWGIAPRARLPFARLSDIAPTIRRLFGLKAAGSDASSGQPLLPLLTCTKLPKRHGAATRRSLRCGS